MAGEPIPFIIPVTGPLNTSDPKSAVPTGTLIEAVDCAHRHIGPRVGRSRAASAQSVSAISRSVYELDGTNDYWLHRYVAAQFVLGLEWTLDVLFEPTVVGVTSGTLVSVGSTVHTDIQLFLIGTGGGADERKVRATVQASDSGAANGSAVTVTDSTQRTLALTGTPALDPTLIYHARLVRNGAALSLKVNGTETTGTGLSTTKGHEFVGDGMYVGGHSTLAANYLGGWVYKVLLRTGVFTDLRDGWMDSPHTKAPHVLLATTGGPPQLWAGSSSGFAQEQSRFRNFGSVVGSPGSDGLTASPLQPVIQGMGFYTDRYGITRNLVVANGRLFHERAT